MSVQFDLSPAHLTRWLSRTGLNKTCSDTQREQHWTRAQPYIQTEIIDRLLTYGSWQDITTASHRKDGVAFVLRGLQGAKTSVLYIPQRINDLTNISLWTPRLEASNLIARSDATLETLVPALVDYFYFLQCILPGSLIITGVSTVQGALPLIHWITNRQQTFKHIFGEAGYRVLYCAPAGGCSPSPVSKPLPAQKKKKKSKPRKARTGAGSSRPSYNDVDTGYDWTACSKDHCGWCDHCDY